MEIDSKWGVAPWGLGSPYGELQARPMQAGRWWLDLSLVVRGERERRKKKDKGKEKERVPRGGYSDEEREVKVVGCHGR